MKWSETEESSLVGHVEKYGSLEIGLTHYGYLYPDRKRQAAKLRYQKIAKLPNYYSHLVRIFFGKSARPYHTNCFYGTVNNI